MQQLIRIAQQTMNVKMAVIQYSKGFRENETALYRYNRY